MKQEQLLAQSSQVLIENYGRLPLAFVKGQGSRVWDADGKEYLDLFAGFGAGGVGGHCHPEIVDALQTQAGTLLSHGNLYTNLPQIEAAAGLIRHAFPGKVFFCHSGAEANEAALKLVRRAAGPGRYKIISFENCFHGRTMGGLSLTPPSFQESFEPMLPGNIFLPWGNLAAVEAAVDAETAGIFVEPIQGEGGMNIPAPEFMEGLRKLCDQHNLLLVCDEVWTAPARTGKWFGYQHYNLQPDVMTLAKAVGGGAPLGACVVADRWSGVLTPGTHGCTMGGNPLCAAAAAAAIRLIERDKLDQRAERLGTSVMEQLRSSAPGCVSDIRGRGLMIGIQLDAGTTARDIMLKGIERGILIGVAKQNVVRLAPALTISESDLQSGIDRVLALLGTK